METGSRYAAADAPPSYSHRFHAGNVGDVWKHCALVEVLRRLADGSTAGARRRGGKASSGGAANASAAPVRYVETHAGAGRYPLAATGEWTEGIGRLWTARSSGDEAREAAGASPIDTANRGDVDTPGADAVARYVALCRRLGGGTERPETYPGSPLFARAALGSDATLTLAERDADACRRLRAALAGEPRVQIVEGDGFALLAATHTATVVLVDPPWTHKTDWIAVPDALAAATRALPSTTFVLWYPVKSLTRPNAMHARLEAAGVSATIAEVVTTSLKHQRHRLNGSGVLLVRPPAGAVETLAAAGSVIGERCATRAGAWWCRMQAW